MEHITVGQVSIALAFIVATLTTIGTLKVYMKKWLNSMLKDEFADVKKHIKDIDDKLERTTKSLSERIDDSDYEACKSYIVKVISDIEQGQGLSETAAARFYEVYEQYRVAHHGNGYIKSKVDELERDKKLKSSSR